MSGIIGKSPDMKSGVLGKFPTGQVVQCLSKHHGGTLESTTLASSDSFTKFTDLEISITPARGSKVMVFCQVNVSGSNYNDPSPVLALFRDTTKIGSGDTASARIRASVGTTIFSGGYNGAIVTNVSWNYLDDPVADGSTAFVYKIGLGIRGTGAGTAYINRSPSDGDSTENQRDASNITVMEVAT